MDYYQISILFVLAAVFGIIAKAMKQPVFVGYLLAGVFLSATGFIGDFDNLQMLGHIGVTLLLFLMGLEMRLKDFASVGRTAFITGLSQITVSFVSGFLISILLGLPAVSAFFVGLAFSFSSTIIAVKLISERKDLVSLYGRIAVGILLLQDIVALIVLMFLSGGNENGNITDWIGTFIRGSLVLLVTWILSKKTISVVFEKFVEGSSETMFVLSIAWALGYSTLVHKFTGFNLEVGGFLAGISLSSLPEHLQIATKARPLRDFFLTIFFLILGAGVVVSGDFSKVIIPAIFLSLLVIIIHTFVVMITMGALGYKKRTSFFTGLTISQISEFSLIVSSLGLATGRIGNYENSLIATTGVVTMIASTYLVTNSEFIFNKMKKKFSIFEIKKGGEPSFLSNKKIENHVILVGCDKTGSQIAKFFMNKKIGFVVVDFDPKVFTKLTAQNIPVVFGDINDEEIIETSGVNYSDLVILTTSNLSDNLNFLSAIRNLPHKPKTIFTSVSKLDAIKLYESGASYVIVPDIVAGEHIKHLLRAYGVHGEKLSEAGKDHFKKLIFI